MPHQKYIDQLDEMTIILSQKPQTVGFVHKFFVPGWIGFIQECFVEDKMSKVAKRPIYNGLGYFECGERIIELVSNACKARTESNPEFTKSNDDVDNLRILSSAMNAMAAWTNVYPEIAKWMNRKVGNRYVTSALGIIQRDVKKSISSIMDVPSEGNNNRSSSFMREIKDLGKSIAAYTCNMIIFCAIFSVLIAVFG